MLLKDTTKAYLLQHLEKAYWSEKMFFPLVLPSESSRKYSVAEISELRYWLCVNLIDLTRRKVGENFLCWGFLCQKEREREKEKRKHRISSGDPPRVFVGSTYKLLNSDSIMRTKVGTNVYDMSLFYNFSSTAIARIRPGLLLDGN